MVMMETEDCRDLTLDEVAARCAAGAERCCFELFRAALADRDQRAWSHVLAQYGRLVGFWIRRHPRFAESGEELDYFTNAAFARMGRAISPGKFDDFAQLGQLLKFLKRCAFAAVVDFARAADREPPRGDPGRSEPGAQDPLPSAGSEAWQRCIEPRLRNQEEWLVAYASWTLELRPAEILSTWPDRFDTVRTIFQVKANLLERLRRDASLRPCLQDA